MALDPGRRGGLARLHPGLCRRAAPGAGYHDAPYLRMGDAMRRWLRAARVWVALVLLIPTSLAHGFPEPPPEVDPGADYVTEARDSVPDGALELAWQARGQAGRSGF